MEKVYQTHTHSFGSSSDRIGINKTNEFLDELGRLCDKYEFPMTLHYKHEMIQLSANNPHGLGPEVVDVKPTGRIRINLQSTVETYGTTEGDKDADQS